MNMVQRRMYIFTANAMVQDSPILYRQCSYRDIHAKNGYARWGHVQCHDMYIHGTYAYVQCTDTYIHENVKMLQESYPPDEAILSMYIPVLTLYVQNQ